MGARADRLGMAARRAANAARWRRFIDNGVANQPDASVLGPEFRDETDMEVEVKTLETRRTELQTDLAQLQANQDDSGVADQLRREIEQLEGVIAAERKQTKKD